MRFLHIISFVSSFLKQVEAGEYENPNKVYKMPVKPRFFNHQVMASSFERSVDRHNKHDNVDDHSREHVESMKTCYCKKEICKVGC
jgi:hypothetical protein